MKYVLGLGRTGTSLSKYLLSRQIPFIAWDDSDVNCEKAALMGVDIVAPTKAPWHAVSEVICSPGIPLTFPHPHKAVELANQYHIPITGDVDCWARLQQGRGCQFVGITGTNGKSTTHSMIQHVLTSVGKPVFSGGNNGLPVFDSGQLPKGTIINLELSSYQLDLINNIEFQVGVLLNITPDHIDRHGSMSAYIAAKRSLIDAVIDSGIKIIGIDTLPTMSIYESIKEQGRAHNLIPISLFPITDGVYVQDRHIYRSKQGYRDRLGEMPANLVGNHQAQNLMAALLTCEHLGVPIETFFETIASYKVLEHRQEKVMETTEAVFINDSKATNADATLPALKSFKNIFWIVGGVSKDEGVVPLVQQMQNVKRVYLIGASAQMFAEQLQPANIPLIEVGTLEESLKKIQDDLEGSREQVTVLLSPAAASFDQFLNFEDRGKQFKKLVEKIFNQGASCVL